MAVATLGRLPLRLGAAAACGALLILAAPAAVAQEPADRAAQCADPVPIDDISQGMQAIGLTVVRGTAPEPFAAEVVGLLDDGIAPDVPMIIVRASSPQIDEVGVWLGMSGSPVFDDRGRLLGAVAYKLADAPTPVAGLTPAAEMLALLDRGDGPQPGDTGSVAIP